MKAAFHYEVQFSILFDSFTTVAYKGYEKTSLDKRLKINSSNNNAMMYKIGFYLYLLLEIN